MLDADDACLIDASGGSYVSYGGASTDWIADEWLWSVQRELITAGEPIAFRLSNSTASRIHPIARRVRCEYAAALLPIAQSPAHMLVVRGAWSSGLGASRARLLTAALPALARLAERRKAFDAAVADRALLASMHEISMADGIEATLRRGAKMIATLASIDYATLLIVDSTGKESHSATNVDVPARLTRPDRDDAATLAFNRLVMETRRSVVFEDAQNDKRLSRQLRHHLGVLQIQSIAVVPLIAGDRAVGIMIVCSSPPRRFDADDLAMLDKLGRYAAIVASGALARDELARTEERLRVVAANAPIVLFSIDPDGRFTLSEGRGLERLGLAPGQVVGQSVFDLYADDPDVIENISRALAGESFTGTARAGEMVFDTHYAPVLDAAGNVTSVVGVATDVTERTRALTQLAEQARRDPLTGVLNHAAITRLVEEQIRIARPFAVAMVDVDGMKVVNDTYGHLSGDAVLKAVATALASDEGIAGRYGGDEFLVVVPGADSGAAEAFAARMAAHIHETKLIDAETSATIRPPVSIGVAVFPGEASTLVDLIRVADSAMYAAKSRRAHEQGLAVRRLDDRVAAMIGDLVPLLTSPGSLEQKLKLVAARLSDWHGLRRRRLPGVPRGEPLAEHARRWEYGRAHGTVACGASGAWPGAGPSDQHDTFEDTSPDCARGSVERRAADGDAATTACFGRLAVRRRGANAVEQRADRDTVRGVAAPAAAFGPRDAQFLAAVANQVTAIVRMAGLVDSLQKATDRLSGSQAETVMMLAAAAEAHDHTTGLHLLSIRSLSEAIAQELGYAPAAVRELGLAATLHDIGKISVPDSVLSSPIRFDSDDLDIARMWQTMKRHSLWGAEFLAGKPGFELAAKVARWHHERWDGGGYPDGIAGDAIPEEVRIVTVADALDAMVQDRPYRAGRPAAEAIQELLRCRGQQFDPAVVEAALTLYERGELPLPGVAEERAAA